MGELIVTGASGHLGRLVLKELLETHKVAPAKIIAIARKVEDLAEWKAKGVEVRKGDFNDAASLKTAFKGGKRLLLVATNVPGPERLKQHETAIREAAAAGVTHIVFTGQVTPPAGLTPTFPELAQTEQILANTKGITYAIVAFNIWTESLLEFYGAAIATGTFYTSSAAGKAAHISREDYSKACAAALASTATPNAKFEVTGPESLERRQVVETINKVLGLSIKIVEVPDSEILDKLKSQLQNDMLGQFAALFDAKFKEGQVRDVGDGFFKLTGKQPEKFCDFLQRNKAKYAPKK